VCGIAALVDPDGTIHAGVGEAMAAALEHRGPDGSAVVRAGNALLVHTRLAIIDPAGGRQPLCSEDERCAVVVNGEIYNHEALRERLEGLGHRFRTRSDSEVIVHAYEEYGLDCVEHLNGIFAFALWDGARERLVLARDPFGVKPLYWWTDGRRVAAASEVGALLAAGVVSPRLDPVALDHILAWRFVPAPRTIFAGVSKLAPASMLIVEGGAARPQSYRRPPEAPLTDASAEELAHELRAQIVAAVERQLMSDVGYGAFLSGGIDSAAVVAAIGERAAEPARTFTIGFPDQRTRDERAAAAETAAVLGTVHQDTDMRQPDFARALARCIGHLEEPCGSQSSPALFELSRFTARSVKVVLSGQGVDEPLAGYKRAQAAAALRVVERVPRGAAAPLRRVAAVLPRGERIKRGVHVLGAEPGVERLLAVFDITDPTLRMELTGGRGEGAAAERRALVEEVISDVPSDDPLDQALYLDTRLVLPDSLLLYGDKMSMAFGLEHRVPFLDLELMSFVERIPGRMRMRHGVRKWLYRRAIRDLVPASALARPKQGFTTPYDRWMRQSLGTEVERRYAPGGALADVLDARTVARLVREHRLGRGDHKRILYCLLEFSEWHRQFIEGAVPEPLAEPSAA
jgi:asparagine synthase (glutamine-hydrolysing)